MRGSRLVTTERVVCFASPGSDDAVDQLDAAMDAHDATPTGLTVSVASCASIASASISTAASLLGDAKHTTRSVVTSRDPRIIPTAVPTP